MGHHSFAPGSEARSGSLSSPQASQQQRAKSIQHDRSQSASSQISNPQASNPQASNPQASKPQILNNRYRLVKVLGRGGFGITALAKDYQLPGHPECVIKQLCPLIQDQETLIRARYRFQREAKSLAILGGHAQIPLLLNYFEQKGQFFLVQEFIPGNTLTQLVKLQGIWKEAAVLEFLKDILPVLGYVHQKGVIHRDLKPSNIMWSLLWSLLLRCCGCCCGFCCGCCCGFDWSCSVYRDWETDRKSTRLNSSHSAKSRMPSSA